MEFDSGFNFASVDAEYWESLVTDPKIDSEKILEEAREQEKLADDGDVKVMVDSAFRMEGGGYVKNVYKLQISRKRAKINCYF